MSATRLLAFTLLIFLSTACSERSQIAEPEAAPADIKPEAAESIPKAVPENQLPSTALGTFDQNQEACSSGTFTKLTVTPDKLQFYYGYADIKSVTLRDEGYNIDATFFQLEGAMEVRPEAATYRIEPEDQGEGIRFKNNPTGEPPSLLVRCD
ncbi:MAG: hypothetical protein WBA76_02860 [Phormidesmis sp.]